MSHWSTFKTLIFCQPLDNRSFQSYSQLSFPSLVDPPHSDLHYCLSHVRLTHCEKWWVRHLLQYVTMAFRTTKILSTLRPDIPVAFRAI